MSGIFVIIGSLGAAAFGILGQITQFRAPDGRIKSRAKFVLMGVAASAILSLASGWLSERESRQAASTRQENLLRTIWRESNRIEAANVSVQMTYSPIGESKQAPPVILDENWAFSLAGRSAGDVRDPPHLKMWSSKPLLQKPEFSLEANTQTIMRRRTYSVDGISYRQITTYSNFSGEMGGFVDALRWNGALVEAHLVASAPGLAQRLWGSLYEGENLNNDFKSYLNKQFSKEYEVPDLKDSDVSVMPLPSNAKLVLYVHNRPIGTARAILAQVREWDEDVRGLVVAKFPVMEIPANTFPNFRPTTPEESPPANLSYTIVQVVGWLVVAAIVVAAVGVVIGEKLVTTRT